MEKSNPFIYINNVSWKKEDIDEFDIVTFYNPYITNKSLSYHADSAIYANEMNMRHHMDPMPQYQFYLNTLRARKRVARWAKADNDDVIRLISQHYNYSEQKASEVVDLFDDDMINELRDYNNKIQGGLEK